MYNNKIRYIELVFENCECVKLKPKMFKYFRLYGVKDIIDINCYQYENGEYEQHKTCEQFSIEILPEGLKQILSMEEITLEERLKRHSDIVSVYIIYEDGKEVSYYVPWPDNEDYTNTYQELMPGFEDNSLQIKIEERELNLNE